MLGWGMYVAWQVATPHPPPPHTLLWDSALFQYFYSKFSQEILPH